MPIRIERHDSPLGRWLLARWAPARLAGVVEEIWSFEGRLTVLRERHFPNGRLSLVIQLGALYNQVVGDRLEPFSQACLSGLTLASDVIEAPPEPTAVLGMQLLPAGAYGVLGRPLHELTGITVDLRDVAGDAADELLERCAAAASPRARLRAAGAWVRDRLERHGRSDPAVSWMAGEIERCSGAVTISRLRDRTGWSKSRLATRFREQVGVSPKTFARVVRFRKALEGVSRGDPLAEVAQASGYFDQPHFNADFREFAGFTPTEYRERSRFPESLSLPESAG